MREDADISPEEFIKKWEGGELNVDAVLDVREPFEWEYYHLDNTLHMPMNTIPYRLEELPRDRTVFVVCAHGVRSAAVCDYLERQGLTNICNVLGGMSAIAALRGFRYD